MSEYDQLRGLLFACRKTVKAQRATLGNLLALLTDLEQRLDMLANAQPQEAKRNGKAELYEDRVG